MKCLLFMALTLCVQLDLHADQPGITSFDNNGVIVWTNGTSSGYCTVEWAPSVTGSWARSWQGLYDVPSVIGETRLQVPMFYRVAWSPTSSVVNLPSLPQLSDFIASGGANYVGLSWTVPANTNVAGVYIARDDIWYPSDPHSGTLIYSGIGNSTIDSQVNEGTKYYYKAFTYDASGNYSVGVTVTATPLDAVAPQNVSSFTALAGDHLVSLGWRNPVSTDFAGVRVVRTTGSPPTGPGVGSLVYAGMGTNVTDSGLSNGTFYYYKAYSFDAVPNYSSGTAASALPLNTLPPGNVSGLSAVAGDERVSLSWVNPIGGDFLGVRVQRKLGSAPTSPTDGVTVYDGAGIGVTNLSLVNGTEYFYRIYSYDEVPNYSSGVGTSSIPADVTAPGSVSNLVIIPLLGNISIRWANPADADLAGIRVVRKTTGYPTNITDGVLVYQGLATNTVDAALLDGIDTNYYRIFSIDEVPNFSTGMNGSLIRPRPVTSVRTVSGDEQVIISWTNPAIGNFSGVHIQRTVGLAPSNALDGVTVYEGLGTSFTNVSLVNNTQYYYALFAFDALPHYSAGVVTNSTPADITAPSNVSAFAVAPVSGGIGLSWGNPADTDLHGVRILRKTNGYPSTPTDGFSVFDGVGTSATDNPLSDSVTTNFYRAFAYDEVPNFSTGTNCILVRQVNVTGFSATPRDAAVILRWINPVSANFAGVAIQQSTKGAPTNALDGSTVYIGVGTSFTNETLINTVRYYYAAFAFDATPNYAFGAFTNAIPIDTNAPGNISNLVAISSNGAVILSWVNPVDTDLIGIRIQRKVGVMPTNYEDGLTIFNGLDTTFIDGGLENCTNYYYRAFSFDEVPNYSLGTAVTAMPVRVALSENFENENGWQDHGIGSWAQTANSGAWSAASAGAVTYQALSRSGLRHIVINSGGYLYLPIVDYPSQVSVWIKGADPSNYVDIQLQCWDGLAWYTLKTYGATGIPDYRNYIFTINFTQQANTSFRFRASNNALLLDDIEILAR